MRKLERDDIEKFLFARILVIPLPFFHCHLDVLLRVHIHDIEQTVGAHAHPHIVDGEIWWWHLNAETILRRRRERFKHVKMWLEWIMLLFDLTFCFTSNGMLKPNCWKYLKFHQQSQLSRPSRKKISSSTYATLSSDPLTSFTMPFCANVGDASFSATLKALPLSISSSPSAQTSA